MKSLFTLFVFVLVSSGCASRGPMSERVSFSDNYVAITKAQKILIIPVKNNFTKKNALGTAETGRALESQLIAEGWNASTMDRKLYEETMSQSSIAVGGIFSPVTGQVDKAKYKALLSVFIELINQRESVDIVIFPYITVRSAKLHGGTAAWDGVVRRKVTSGANTHAMSWSGTEKSLSLQLNTYTSAGNFLFTSFGGLTLPFVTRLTFSQAESSLREDMFDNAKDIAEGVDIALEPILMNSAL